MSAMRALVATCCLAALACNQFYDLEGTAIAPPPPDRDGDGVGDGVDNCPLFANLDQLDRDTDGFGDACDACPATASPANHDEDGDTHGDVCDLCPAQPDFQLDTDGDGVGDECDHDFATRNARVLFDPFTDIDPAWEPVTETWAWTGDTVVPTAGATRLRHAIATVDGTRRFWLRVGLSASTRWDAGDELGIELVDPVTLDVIGGCQIACTGGSSCMFTRVPHDDVEPPPHVVPTAFGTLAFNHAVGVSSCVFETTVAAGNRLDFAAAQLVLVGSPRVQVRYVVLYQ